jgi:hypothetical protein
MSAKSNGAVGGSGKRPTTPTPSSAEHYTAPMSEVEVQRIARAVAPLVLAQLAAALTGAGDRTLVYSTRVGCSPPGYSRDAWRDLARRIGRRRGRYWFVSHEELDAYEHRERDPKPANDPAPSKWHPSQAARALGLRPAGESR